MQRPVFVREFEEAMRNCSPLLLASAAIIHMLKYISGTKCIHTSIPRLELFSNLSSGDVTAVKPTSRLLSSK